MSEYGEDEPSSVEAPRARDLLPKSRLVAFADGVFAIAITLLVLEIPVPQVEVGLWHALAEEWRTYIAYVLSFAFIGSIWIAHSGITKLMKRADTIMFQLNLLLLLFVSTLPFTTSLMSNHMSGDGSRLAVVIYGINLLIASIMLNIVMLYTAHNPDLAIDAIADEELRYMEKRRRFSVLIGAAGVSVAFVIPPLAVAFYIVQTLLFLTLPLVHVRRQS